MAGRSCNVATVRRQGTGSATRLERVSRFGGRAVQSMGGEGDEEHVAHHNDALDEARAVIKSND